MKLLIMFLIFVCGAHSASCQRIEEMSYELVAEAVDEQGKPLEDIQVITGRLEPLEDSTVPLAKPVTTEPVRTNAQGNAVIKFSSVPEASGKVTFFSEGYYSTQQRVEWNRPDGFDGKTREATVKAVLKPIMYPVPMMASMMNDDKILRFPKIGETYGYDLEKLSLVSPFGKGIHADLNFIMSKIVNDTGQITIRLEITCPTEGDGLVEFLTPQREAMREPISIGSTLISNYIAPEKGYSSALKRNNVHLTDGKINQIDADHTRNFYFRVRTKFDSNGKIISCHYGKIYGDFYFRSYIGENDDFVGALTWEATYFNPNPNDRNVEFDPKRNLLPGGRFVRP